MLIRRLFETRKLRERLLLTTFLWLLLALWLVVLGKSWRDAASQYRLATASLEAQQVYLDEAAFIEQRLQDAQASIDSSRTYTATQLFSAVDGMARDAGLPADIRSQESREAGIFNTYTVRIDARRATLQQIMLFTQAVRDQSPYLALRSFEVRSGSDPRLLDASLVVESFELTESSF